MLGTGRCDAPRPKPSRNPPDVQRCGLCSACRRWRVAASGTVGVARACVLSAGPDRRSAGAGAPPWAASAEGLPPCLRCHSKLRSIGVCPLERLELGLLLWRELLRSPRLAKLVRQLPLCEATPRVLFRIAEVSHLLQKLLRLLRRLLLESSARPPALARTASLSGLCEESPPAAAPGGNAQCAPSGSRRGPTPAAGTPLDS